MKGRTVSHRVYRAALAALLSSVSAPALLAQQVPPVKPAAQVAGTQEQVIVTARRRNEQIDKVPVSIAALGRAQLAAKGIHTEADLQAAVPGLTIRQTVSQNQLSYSIRGQSVDAFSGSAPGVLPYIDEIQVSANTATAFYDLASIQVLKGPQGTLFGRNATGGAVLYETAKPTPGFGGYIQSGIGNYNSRYIEGALNVPIVPDKVLLRVSGTLIKDGGYVHNLFNNSYLGGQNTQTGRVTLVIKPQEGLTNTLTGQYGYYGGTNSPTQLYSANACGATNGGIVLLSSTACLYNPAFPGFAAFLAAHPGAYPGGIEGFLNYQKSLGPWQADVDFPSGHKAHAGFISNTTVYDISADLTLKNIIGGTHSASAEQNDFDGTPYPVFAAGSPAQPQAELFRTDQFSDELQVQGKAFNDNLTYLFGGYYERELDTSNYPLLAFDLSPVIPGTPVHYNWKITDESLAVYSQATYKLGGGFSVTGGIRYTDEMTSIDQLEGSIFAGAPQERIHDNKPSWTASLEYQATPELLLYAASRGSWRAGGFNGTSPAVDALAAGGGNVFQPETTEDVEIGAKYNGHVAGMPVRLEVAGYNQWVNNIQRTAYLILDGNPLAITVNVPRAQISGLEVNADVTPLPWLQLGANLSYAYARFTDPTVTFFGNTLNFGPYADTPRVSGAAFSQITLPVGDRYGEFVFRTDVYAQTIDYFSNLNSTINPGTQLPGYVLVNLRLDWNHVMGSALKASLYARNVGDARYYVGGIPQGADLGLNQSSPGRPRMYGGELRYDF
jgi:iron complex outermembrane receptor protein